MKASKAGPPRNLVGSIALLAAGMLLIELIVTRLFSVLFFYHYSFFAVSLVMSGLTLGGLLASRWHMKGATEEAFNQRLATLAVIFSAATMAALVVVAVLPSMNRTETPAM